MAEKNEEIQTGKDSAGTTLRLGWPQWQGAGSSAVSSLMPDFSLAFSRRGYVFGSTILNAVLPETQGSEALVDVPVGDAGLATENGVEEREAVANQLGDALAKIDAVNPDRILTLGGDCAVSVAPFSALGAKYRDDVAVVWVDSHPDSDTAETEYLGYHAMAVSALLGHGDEKIVSQLPYAFPAHHVALVGVHAGEEDAFANVREWGLTVFPPDKLRLESGPLLDWLKGTGCTKVVLHFDVDTIDSDELWFGLGADRGGLSSRETRRIIQDVSDNSEVVGFTIAEFIPRQVLHLLQFLNGAPSSARSPSFPDGQRTSAAGPSQTQVQRAVGGAAPTLCLYS